MSTIVAASRATSVPRRAHRDADVGAPQRRRVVDAVAGHRDDVARARAARRRSRSFASGRAARDDQLAARRAAARRARRRPSRRARARSTIRGSLVDDADLAARSRPRSAPWSPVMTMMRMPARWQRATASATSGRGGSSSATRPRNVSADSARSRSSGSRLGSGAAVGEAEHAQAVGARSASNAAAIARAAVGVERPVAVGASRTRVAALEQLQRRALGVEPAVAVGLGVDRASSACRRGSKWNSRRRAASRSA